MFDKGLYLKHSEKKYFHSMTLKYHFWCLYLNITSYYTPKKRVKKGSIKIFGYISQNHVHAIGFIHEAKAIKVVNAWV